MRWQIATQSRMADCRPQIGLKIGAAVLAALAFTACGVPPERSIVDEFFAESRLRDKTALQHVATVAYEPHINGIVETFEIKKVSPELDNTKTVIVAAQVKLPDGGTADKTIILTMARGAGKIDDDPAGRDRWIVTGFIESAAPPHS
jgi:hypothetical protein